MLDTIKMSLLGVYNGNPQLLRERNEIAGYYNFYDGEAKNEQALLNENTRGQSWLTNTDLDYTPSQVIRNHTKKLLKKQSRFMFGAPPTILLKPLNKGDINKAEDKRMALDQILDEANLWGHTAKAFLDCTIGKRVLLTVIANPDEPIQYRYYPADEFTYETDPNDYNKLMAVTIAYLDEDTANKKQEDQIWHRWRYYMQGEQCWLEAGQYNGMAKPIGEVTNKNTGLDELPCRVILNDGLTGDIEGNSDIVDLMGLADTYNKVTSDYQDALKFRMFEQPVFTDADSESLQGLKVAPNAVIDLKTDPALETGKADAKMLSSNFSFVAGADAYLDRVKSDMYEIMDQPRPEDLRDVPSAKALRYMFYDLISRCEEKWQEWEPALKWLIRFTFKCIDKWDLYPELNAKQTIATPTNIVLKHNYPIPDDEDMKKETAMKEVTANVRSHKSYIRDFSDIENEDSEFNEIMKEMALINQATQDTYMQGLAEGEAGTDLDAGDAGGKVEDTDPNKGNDNKGTKGTDGAEE